MVSFRLYVTTIAHHVFLDEPMSCFLSFVLLLLLFNLFWYVLPTTVIIVACMIMYRQRYQGDDYIDFSKIPTWNISYVTAMLKGRPCEFALKGGDASHAGGTLMTLYDGVRPQHNNYNPMKLQGSIILGTGGDDSDGAAGTFFEGAMVRGYVSAATEAAVQASIVAAGYGH